MKYIKPTYMNILSCYMDVAGGTSLQIHKWYINLMTSKCMYYIASTHIYHIYLASWASLKQFKPGWPYRSSCMIRSHVAFHNIYLRFKRDEKVRGRRAREKRTSAIGALLAREECHIEYCTVPEHESASVYHYTTTGGRCVRQQRRYTKTRLLRKNW